MAYIYDLTDTWSAGGTAFNAIKMNVTDSASASGSKLVTLQTNGAEHFSVSKAGVGYFSGSVGIGTSSPTIKLQVTDVDQATARIGVQNLNGQNYHLVAGNPGASNNGFAIFDATASATRMYLDGSGNVGIGTTTPAVPLDVRGSVAIGGPSSSYLIANYNSEILAGVDAGGYYYASGFGALSNIPITMGDRASYIAFKTSPSTAAGSERMRIDSNGNVGIGTSNPATWRLNMHQSGADLLNMYNTAGTGVQLSMSDQNWSGGVNMTSGNLILQAGGITERARLDSSGNFMVGQSSAFSRLTVSNGNSTRTGITLSDGNTASLMLYAGNSAPAVISTDVGNQNLVFKRGSTVGTENGTETMRIDASGNLGINTTAPQARLETNLVASNESASMNAGVVNDVAILRAPYSASPSSGSNANAKWGMRFVGRNDGAYDNQKSAAIYAASEDLGGGFNRSVGLAFHVSSFDASHTERMRLDKDGNLGIGTNAPLARLHVAGSGIFGEAISSGAGVSTNDISMELGGFRTGNGNCYIDLHATASTDFESRFIRAPGVNGEFNILNTGTGPFSITQTGAAELVFKTSNNERARIDASGNLLVGTTAAPQSGVQGVQIGTLGFIRTGSATTAGTGHIAFNNPNGEVGLITTSGTGTSYNTSSDYRLKDIDGPIANSGAYIDALKPVQGSWKADGSRFIGLLAHEVQEVSETPIATGEKDGEEMQAMDYSAPEIIANLIAEIQSLRARVAQLEGN